MKQKLLIPQLTKKLTLERVKIIYNVFLLPLQYGVLADMYSLAIILFELFSGMNPFPGNIGQICQAKNLDEKPEIPLEFPTALKNLIIHGWSKKPRERPEIKKFIWALKVLKQEEETKQRGKVQMTDTHLFNWILRWSLLHLWFLFSKFERVISI